MFCLHPLYVVPVDARFAWVPYVAHMNTQHSQKIPLSAAKRRFAVKEPHAYRIMIGGALDRDWSDRLGGLWIELYQEGAADYPVTVLQGLIQDHAQLSGVLNTLCNLRLPLLGVELIEDDRADL